MNWTFLMHTVLGCNSIAFIEQMQVWISRKPWDFGLFLIFTLSQHLSTLPPGFLDKLIIYCCWATVTCMLNRTEREVAFLRKFHEWNSMNLFLSSPFLNTLCSANGCFHLARCFCYNKLFRSPWIGLLYAHSGRLPPNCVFWVSMRTWVFFLFIRTVSPTSEHSHSRLPKQAPFVLLL